LKLRSREGDMVSDWIRNDAEDEVMQCEKVLREAVCGNVSRTGLAEIAGGDVVCSFLRAFTCDVMFSLHTETRSDDESKAIPILCTRYVVSKEVR
jgi:hypothetical protein